MPTTIVAAATPPGESALAVVRMSGPQARSLLERIFIASGPWVSHRLSLGTLIDDQGSPIDRCMAVWMQAPSTYTGEDIVEFYPHGSPIIAMRLIEALLRLGAEPAQPGEFTRRAFENGKLDLSQAEAVMDLIAARTVEEQARALRRHRGEAARSVARLQEALTDLLAELEAELNYPEEDLPNIDPQGFAERVSKLIEEVSAAHAAAEARLRLERGIRVAIIGESNAGKSSLLNAIVGMDRVMVSDIPGTTRDVVEQEVLIGGLRMILCDTAGLRETEDPLEREGQRRARSAWETADALILVIDATQRPLPPFPSNLPGIPLIIAHNKCDLLEEEQDVQHGSTQAADAFTISVSARTGMGIERLKQLLADRFAPAEAQDWLAGERAMRAAQSAQEAMRRALAALQDQTMDIAAEELREAWHDLGTITGVSVDEAIIDRVFEKFCLGK